MKTKFLVLVILIAAFVSACGKHELSDGDYIVVSQDIIKNKLKDPVSAEFRNSTVSRVNGNPVVCGEVNAKNGFGGYTGFQRFVSGPGMSALETDMAAGEMDKVWMQICKR